MDRYAAAVLGILHDNINELRGAAERAKKAGKDSQLADIADILGRLGFRYLELTLGKKMSFNVNIRTQEDLPDYRALPAEVRSQLDGALDAIEEYQKGRVLPAKALSSAKVEP